MTGIVATLVDGLLEAFGHPASLVRMLADGKDLLRALPHHTTINGNTMLRWHEWWDGTSGRMQGWAWNGGNYQSTSRLFHPLADFGARRKVDAWTCDIRDIQLVTASKAPLDQFSTLDSMIQARAPEMITAITKTQLAENLAHDETARLFKGDATIVRFCWDRTRLMLCNSGGSHHFAAARYIAGHLGMDVPITAPFIEYRIDLASAMALNREFGVFLFNADPQAPNYFHDFMHSFMAPYFYRPIPGPETSLHAIFLPRDVRRAQAVIKTLQSVAAFDLGEHLLHLARQQVS